MTRSGRLLGIAVVLVVIGAAGAFVLRGKAPAAPGSSARVPAGTASLPPPIELSASDLARARHAELQTTLSISGGLRATHSAMVRAKVAAEVKEVSVREGDRVAAGQVIVRLDDTEYQWRLRQAEDQAAAAKAQLEIAERTLANNRALVDQGFISKNALDTSLMSAEGARASLQAARAAAEIARKAVHDSVLRAPLAGLVAQRLVQPGERVGVDARLVEIVDLSRMELEAPIAPEDVTTLRIGQTAVLQLDGLAEPLSATVARINPATQAGTRAVMVYLSVNPHPALRQGLFARGGIQTQRRRALVVPTSAVRLDQARPYVLVAAAADPAAGPVRVKALSVTLGGTGTVASEGAAEAVTEVKADAPETLAEGTIVLRGSVGALRQGARVLLPGAPAAALVSAGPMAAGAPASAPAPSR